MLRECAYSRTVRNINGTPDETFPQPSNPESSGFEVNQHVKTAIAALHSHLIKIRGVGRFADGSVGILLGRDSDADIALVALQHIGLRAAACERN